MKRWKRWLSVLLSSLTIACSPAPIPPPSIPAAPVEMPAAPIDQITRYLSQQTQIPPDQLRVDRVKAVNWPDACLGLPQPDEICAQAITPGFEVEFAAPDRRLVIHSDRTGRSIRLKSQP